MHGHELLLVLAAVVFVLAAGFYLPASWLAWKRARAAGPIRLPDPVGDDPGGALTKVWSVLAAGLALGAAAIHLAVTPAHLAEYVPFGFAFAAVAAAQVGLAIGLLRYPERARVPAIAFSISVVVVWVASRTMGLPIGPHPWEVEAAGAADLIATFFELALIGLLAAPFDRVRGPNAVRVAETASVAVVPVIGIIGISTLIAIGSLVTSAVEAH